MLKGHHSLFSMFLPMWVFSSEFKGLATFKSLAIERKSVQLTLSVLFLLTLTLVYAGWIYEYFCYHSKYVLQNRFH